MKQLGLLLQDLGDRSAAGRYTRDQDTLIQLAKEAERRGITRKEAEILLEWAEEYGVKPALNHIGTNHWIGGSHI